MTVIEKKKTHTHIKIVSYSVVQRVNREQCTVEKVEDSSSFLSVCTELIAYSVCPSEGAKEKLVSSTRAAL